MDFCVLIRTRHHEQKKSLTVAKFLIFGVLAFVPSYVSTTHWSYNNIIWYLKEQNKNYFTVDRQVLSGSFDANNKSVRGYWH